MEPVRLPLDQLREPCTLPFYELEPAGFVAEQPDLGDRLAPGLPELDDLGDDVDPLVCFLDILEHCALEPRARRVPGQPCEFGREVRLLEAGVAHDSADDRPHGLVHRNLMGDQLVQPLPDLLPGDFRLDSRRVARWPRHRVEVSSNGFRTVLQLGLGRGGLRHLEALLRTLRALLAIPTPRRDLASCSASSLPWY